jgi:hypothetical protein
VINSIYSPGISQHEAQAITSTIWETGSSAEIMVQMLWESLHFRQSQRIIKYSPHLHLFAAWCARRTIHLCTTTESRLAIQTAERFATGAATRSEMHQAHRAAEASAIARIRNYENLTTTETFDTEQQEPSLNTHAIRGAAILNAASAAVSCCIAHQLFGLLQAADLSAKYARQALYWEALANGADIVLISELREEEDLRQAHSLRTIIGNPFNPIQAPAMFLPFPRARHD